LYQQALDLTPDRREEILSDKCAGDVGLRAEVEGFLRQGDAAPTQFLAGVLYNKGSVREAIELGEKALAMNREVLVDTHFAVGRD